MPIFQIYLKKKKFCLPKIYEVNLKVGNNMRKYYPNIYMIKFQEKEKENTIKIML